MTATIDEAFVAARGETVAAVEIDGQFVLASTIGGQAYTHWLDPLGTLVWKCFDGVSPLREVIDDLADAFGVTSDVVRADVVELVRVLGRSGLLEGVEGEPPTVDPTTSITGLPVGTPIGPFTLPDVHGRDVHSDEIANAFIVHWSPACGHCAGIASDLERLRPSLRDHGYELVLVAHGSADANLAFAAETGLGDPILLGSDLAAFEGLGTPAAYRIDAAGRISSYLALGAEMVLALVANGATRSR